MDPSTKLMHRDNLVFRVIKEDGIIYDPATRRLHTLNQTALLAWNLWDGKHSLDDVVDAILSEYSADPEQVMQDVMNCADEMSRHGLLRDAA